MKENSSFEQHMPQFVFAVFGSDHDAEPDFLGSGWYAGYGVVITCKHVICNASGPRAERFLVGRSSSDRFIEAHETILSATDDLALLRVVPLDFEPPAMLTGLTLELLPRLRSWGLSAFGFDDDDHVQTLKRFLMQEALILAGALARLGTITDLQFSGGFPAGFSGGPLISPNGNAWVCSGMVRLGKKEAATSRVIAPDTIKAFLDEHGVEYCSTRAADVLSSCFLNSTADERFEVKQMAVLFTDMANSTEFAEKFGGRDAYRKRMQHNDLLLPLIESHGGTLVEIVGDSLFAVFDAPQDAAHCAISMQRTLKESNRLVDSDVPDWEIHIRIGMHFGKALMARDPTRLWVLGQAVNVAARVESGGGKQTDQILVSDAMANLLDPFKELVLEPFGVISAKGVGELRLYSLLWEEGSVASPPRSESDLPPTLAAETSPVNFASQNVGACHCLFIDPRDDRGYVIPVYASVKPSNSFSVTCKSDCDKVAEAAANRAVLAAFNELKGLGFATSLDNQEVNWWINKSGFRCVGASLGLGVALATVAAHTSVQIDPSIAVTGSVDEHCVMSVAGIATKWRSLESCRKFKTLILPSANLNDLPRGALNDSEVRVIDVPTVHAAILDVFGPAFGIAGRRLSAATAPATLEHETGRIELWVQRAVNPQLTRDVAIVSEEATHSWKVGDKVRICARTDRDCHLAVLNVGTSGKITVLVPNEHHPDTFLRTGESTSFPAIGDRFSFEFQGPPGRERLIAFASRHPLKLLPHNFDQSGRLVACPTTRDIGIVADDIAGSVLGRTEIEFYVSELTESNQPSHARGLVPERESRWVELG